MNNTEVGTKLGEALLLAIEDVQPGATYRESDAAEVFNAAGRVLGQDTSSLQAQLMYCIMFAFTEALVEILTENGKRVPGKVLLTPRTEQ